MRRHAVAGAPVRSDRPFGDEVCSIHLSAQTGKAVVHHKVFSRSLQKVVGGLYPGATDEEAVLDVIVVDHGFVEDAGVQVGLLHLVLVVGVSLTSQAFTATAK